MNLIDKTKSSLAEKLAIDIQVARKPFCIFFRITGLTLRISTALIFVH